MNKKSLLVGSLIFLLSACGAGESSSNDSGSIGSEESQSSTVISESLESSESSESSEEEESSSEPVHEHDISSTWSNDDTYHWKTCSGCDEVFEKAAHVLEETGRTLRGDKSCYDVTYECSVCGYETSDTAPYTLTKDDLLELLAEKHDSLADNASKLKSYTSSFGSNSLTTTITYELGKVDGKDAFKFGNKTSYADETTYGFYDGDNPIGYRINNSTNAVSKPTVNANDFKGYHFTSNFFMPAYNANIYGVDDVFEILYNAFIENDNNDQEISIDDDGAFNLKFGYSYISYGTTYYYVADAKVEFDESGIIKNYESNYSQYMAADVIVDDELGTFEVSEGVTKPVYMFTYSAVAGEREAITLPYSLNDFKFTSFELSYNGVAIEANSTIEVEVGAGNNFSAALSNKTPATASADFDAFTIALVDVDTEQTPTGYSSFSSYNNSFTLAAAVGKTYKATITTAGGVSFTFSYLGKAPAPSSLTLNFASINGSTLQYQPFESVVYKGKTINIFASVLPATAGGDYTLVIKNSSDETVTCEKGTATYNGKQVDYYTFVANELGTYTVTATSTVKSSITATNTFEVKDAPSLDEVINGDFYRINTRGGGVIAHMVFTPNLETEAIDGTLVFTYMPNDPAYTKVATYSYSLDTDGVTVLTTLVDGEAQYEDIKFTVSNSYKLSIQYKETGVSYYTNDTLYLTEQGKQQ